METEEVAATAGKSQHDGPQQQKQQLPQEQQEYQEQQAAFLRHRAAARQERLLARQAQRMRIVQGMETAASASSIRNCTDPRNNQEGCQDVGPSDPARLPSPGADLQASSSSSNNKSNASRLKQRVDLFAVCLGIGAGVNTMLREEVSPHRLFEALGFPYGPASWSVLCWICGMLLYLPLPLVLVVSLTEQLSRNCNSSINGSIKGFLCAAANRISPAPQAGSSDGPRPRKLQLIFAAAARTAVAAQPHFTRLSLFLVAFCCTTTLVRILAAVGGCCK